MKRLSIVAAVLVLVGIGIVDPYACVQYGTGGGLERDLSKKDRDSLLRVALRVRDLVPVPGAGYVADRESDEASADAKAPWDDPAGKWMAPGAARAIRIYPPTNPDAVDAPPTFEVRIHVNEEAGMPQALTSVFDATRPFAVDGAVAVEVPTVGTDDAVPAPESGSEGGRIAMPMSPESVAQSITIVRILVAGHETERALRAALEGKAPERAARKPVDRADRVESVTVELYGGKRDVEGVARRVPIAKLRAVLSK
jgi:hypothetical protein